MSQTKINTLGKIAGGSISNKFAYDYDNTTGLTFAYFGGIYSLDGNVVDIPAGTVTLTDNSTNVIELTTSGLVHAHVLGNEGGYTLFKVITSAGAITSITDYRGGYVQ